jgi:hypothetical protein
VCILAYCRNAHESATARRSLQRKFSFNGARWRRYFCRHHISLEMCQLACVWCCPASRAGAPATSSRVVKEEKKVRRTPGRAVEELHHQSLAGTGAPHFSPASQNPRFGHTLFARFGWIFKRAEGSCDRSLEASSPLWQRWWLPVMARKQASFMLMMTGSSLLAMNTDASDKL